MATCAEGTEQRLTSGGNLRLINGLTFGETRMVGRKPRSFGFRRIAREANERDGDCENVTGQSPMT